MGSEVTGSGALPLASPWLRLAAAIIDSLILWPINYLLGFTLLKQPSITDIMEASKKGQDAVDAIMPSTGLMLLTQVVGVAVFIGINFVLLKKGHTIGKKLVKIQVQHRNTGALLTVQDIILKRVLPVYAVGALGAVIHPAINFLLLIDVLMIFRKGRNTLHDDIANSKVVQLSQ